MLVFLGKKAGKMVQIFEKTQGVLNPVLLFLGLFAKIPRKTSKTPRISLTLRTLKNPGK